MSDSVPAKITDKVLENSLSDLVLGTQAFSFATGGSYLSGYGSIAYANNYSLLTLNRIMLTYLYAGNGLFQAAIDLPIQDAFLKRVEIESNEMSSDDIDEFNEVLDDLDLWTKLQNVTKWKRLYGGGALLINTNQEPKEPLNIKTLKKGPLQFYDIDRWQLDYSTVYFDDFEMLFTPQGDREPYFHLWGQPIHESRFLLFRNKRAPSYIRRQLRGWGMSEGERIIRDLNLYLKTQDVLYEILDESKLDIYKIDGLAAKLLNKSGTDAILNRVQAANELKNYLQALVLDSKEDYIQKTMTFSGLAEVSRENRIGIAQALRIPMTKLFGISASGFNAGEDDLESYNQMVESEIRTPALRGIKKAYDMVMSWHFGYVPQYRIKFPPMRVLTAEQEQEVKNAIQTRTVELYTNRLITAPQAMEILKKEGIITIDIDTDSLEDFPETEEESIDAESSDETVPIRVYNGVLNVKKLNVYPEKGEAKGTYIARCVKTLVKEGKTQEQALGQCYGMWKERRGKE